jgi:hypothetical protein
VPVIITCIFVPTVQPGFFWSSVLNTSAWVWGILFINGVVCNVVSSGPGTLRVRDGTSSLAAAARELGVFLVGASVACGLESM